MKPEIDLFTADEFPSFRSHAEEIIAELNTILLEENKKADSGVRQLQYLRQDILNHPNVYLSDNILAKLYVEKNNSDTTQRTQK